MGQGRGKAVGVEVGRVLGAHNVDGQLGSAHNAAARGLEPDTTGNKEAVSRDF